MQLLRTGLGTVTKMIACAYCTMLYTTKVKSLNYPAINTNFVVSTYTDIQIPGRQHFRICIYVGRGNVGLSFVKFERHCFDFLLWELYTWSIKRKTRPQKA